MRALAGLLGDLARLEELAAGRSLVHRIDPRVKLLLALLLAALVASLDLRSPARVVPFAAFPVLTIAAAGVPLAPLLRPTLAACALAGAAALPVALLEGREGALVAASLLLRAAVLVPAALALAATTDALRVGFAVERLGLGRTLAALAVLVWRFAFVLGDEAARMATARALRAPGVGAPGPAAWAALVGSLLVRALRRAGRVGDAMATRSFDGGFHPFPAPRLDAPSLAWGAGWALVLAALRATDAAGAIGRLALGGP